MTFAEELRKKADAKVIEMAKEFSTKFKPHIEQAADEGCIALRVNITGEDLKNLQIYKNELFTNQLEKDLTGVKVKFISEHGHNILGFPVSEYHLRFSW